MLEEGAGEGVALGPEGGAGGGWCGGFGCGEGGAPEGQGGFGCAGAAEKAGFGEEEGRVGALVGWDGGQGEEGCGVVVAEGEEGGGARALGLGKAGELADGGGWVGAGEEVEAGFLVGWGEESGPAGEEGGFQFGSVQAGGPGCAGGVFGGLGVVGHGEGVGTAGEGGGELRRVGAAEGERLLWVGVLGEGFAVAAFQGGAVGPGGVFGQEGGEFGGGGLARIEETDEGDELGGQAVRLAGGEGLGEWPVIGAQGEQNWGLCGGWGGEKEEEEGQAHGVGYSSKYVALPPGGGAA